MDMDEFITLGLTKNQAKVYLELLKHPLQTPGSLAKAVSVDRSFMYSILKSLHDKGLSNHVIKENKRIYQAADPENLVRTADEKRTLALNLVEKLKLMKHSSEQSKSVEVFDGRYGLKLLARAILSHSYFELMGGDGILHTLEQLRFEYQHYIKELKTKKISGKIILAERNFSKLNKLFYGTKIQVKTIKKKPSQVNFVIFSDKVGIFTSEKPRTIIIKDKQVAEALSMYFKIIWSSL